MLEDSSEPRLRECALSYSQGGDSIDLGQMFGPKLCTPFSREFCSIGWVNFRANSESLLNRRYLVQVFGLIFGRFSGRKNPVLNCHPRHNIKTARSHKQDWLFDHCMCYVSPLRLNLVTSTSI